MKNIKSYSVAVLLVLTACGETPQNPPGSSNLDTTPKIDIVTTEDRLVTYSEVREACDNYTPNRMALFGDLHVHTALSFDAIANTIGTDPVDAHRFARGESIPFFPVNDSGVAEGMIQIDRPLDFLAVTDHAEFLGEWSLCRNPNSAVYEGTFCKQYRLDTFTGMLMLASIIDSDTPTPRRFSSVCGGDGSQCISAMGSPWSRMINAAEQAYDRSSECSFTSLIGYEYTGGRGRSNYHRNIIFRNGRVPAVPVSYVEAPTDLELWQQLGARCDEIEGCDFISIPHNSNLSNGKLLTPFALLNDLSKEEQLNYAALRQEREPVMEIFQHKGQSECINGLNSVLGSPDELCDMEQVRRIGSTQDVMQFMVQDDTLVFEPNVTVTTTECEDIGEFGMQGAGCVSRNDFLRGALLTGLEGQRDLDINTAKYGVIASSDTHGSTPGAVKESDWHGHANGETTIGERLKAGMLPSGIKGNPGGLAGVWAVENSRDAIFDAIQRRETFGTSGPRITPRFFAGWNYDINSCESESMIEEGYARGVPMGGELNSLPGNNAAPRFIAHATRDPLDQSTPLQKLQIIKGWLDGEGNAHNKVFDIAGDEGNGASVDPRTAERAGEGHDELCSVFIDPEFNSQQQAYYYLRVVENPSPRWSLTDCLKLSEDDRPAVCSDGSYPMVIQEMAWTSAIWYTP